MKPYRSQIYPETLLSFLFREVNIERRLHEIGREKKPLRKLEQQAVED